MEFERMEAMKKRFFAVGLGVLSFALVICATAAFANALTGASASADCNGYSLTVNANQLGPGTTYTISYTFTLDCGGSIQTVPGTIVFSTGPNETTATETDS